MVSFGGNSFDSSDMIRKITSVSKIDGDYRATLSSSGNGVGGNVSPLKLITWSLHITDPEHMTIVGNDRGVSWSGDYRFCRPYPDAAKPIDVSILSATGGSVEPSPLRAPATPTHVAIDGENGYAGEAGTQYEHNGSRMLLFFNAGFLSEALRRQLLLERSEVFEDARPRESESVPRDVGQIVPRFWIHNLWIPISRCRFGTPLPSPNRGKPNAEVWRSITFESSPLAKLKAIHQGGPLFRG
jgi:hypothetical protein